MRKSDIITGANPMMVIIKEPRGENRSWGRTYNTNISQTQSLQWVCSHSQYSEVPQNW